MKSEIRHTSLIKDILGLLREEFKDVNAYLPKSIGSLPYWHICIKSYSDYTSENYRLYRASIHEEFPDIKIVFVCVDLSKLNCRERITLS